MNACDHRDAEGIAGFFRKNQIEPERACSWLGLMISKCLKDADFEAAVCLVEAAAALHGKPLGGSRTGDLAPPSLLRTTLGSA